jgi:hypothetical protein
MVEKGEMRTESVSEREQQGDRRGEQELGHAR